MTDPTEPDPPGTDPPPYQTRVTRLDLTNFRNYASARVETDGRMVVLTGPNGAGKTNLLEAISFLAPGRGLRRARLHEIDRHAPDAAAGSWAVAARVAGPSGSVAIGTGREGGDDHGDRRVVRIDGAAVRTQVLLAQHANLVWLTPQMDRLFQEGAAPRRRFLDRLVFGFDPGHAGRLAAYEQAMRERGRLLRLGHADPVWLGVLEATMAAEGVAIAAARRDVARRLDDACAASGDGAFPVASLASLGAIETWLDQDPAIAVEDRLRAEFAARRAIDRDAGGATLGAHRADLGVRYAARDVPATDCSTGEQKALLIGIVLAHAALQIALRGSMPILLLDEVSAHLDRSRRRALYARLTELGCQVWLTGTDPELFAEIGTDAHFMAVEDGRIRDGISA